MKIISLICFSFFVSLFLNAQSWNPYVAQGIISPAPLLPIQVNGTGVVSFNVGNTGSSQLLYYPAIPVNNLKLVITLSRGLPNVTPLNPTSALTTIAGSWAAMFNWQYDMVQNAFTGTQNQVIEGQSQGSVNIQYKVTQNSQQTQPLNGFTCVLTPPPYTSGTNSTSDDAVSSYTWTEAKDFGDAPITYGSSYHVIDFDNNYRYLGSLVDNDSAYLASVTANGDDITGSDDEDGVTFPALIQGHAAVIPVMLTGVYGFLNAWVDWNGDGDFGDTGEQVATDLFLLNGTYNLAVNVPVNAFTSVPTFARFRLGPPGIISTGPASWGEIEDYQITIAPFTVAGTVFDDANGMNNNFVDGTGTNASGSFFMNLVKSANNQVLASILVNTNGTYSFGISNGVQDNTNYNLIITTTAQSPGNTLTAATFPANWIPTGENLGTGAGNDGAVDGKLSVNTNSGNVANANFGLDQLPESDNTTGTLTNPGGSNQVVIPTLTGTDPEDGVLGSGSTLVITLLATNGALYYNGIAVTLNQVISIYDPSLLTIDPVNGTPVVTFDFAFMDAAWKQDPTPAIAILTFTDLTLGGNVFDDADGMNNSFVDGTGTNDNGNLYMNLVNSTGNQVVSSLLVSNNGTYSFGNSDGVLANTSYNLIVTSSLQTPGGSLITATFPANWIPTGENLGTGPGNDGTVDGKLTVSINSAGVVNANFGLDQLPDSEDATAAYTNPGGTSQVIVPTLGGSDPEDGSLGVGSTFVITIPAANGTLYYDGTAVYINQVITNYDPDFFTIDPDDGELVVTFNFAFVDAAGKQDTDPAVATLTFSDLTITGTVFEDANGMNNTFVDGTGTNASGIIYMNLVNSIVNQVIASQLVSSNGMYSFGNSNGVATNTSYNLIITNEVQAIGNSLVTASYPVNWVPTGENQGTAAGNDGIIDGKLTVNTNSGNVSGANFGLDQLPNSNDISGTRLNPGGIIQVIVPTISGSDPEDGSLGSGDTFVITTVATNGTLYYNSLAVVADQVITNYNPALLTVDPIDGTPDVTINFACVDSAGKQDQTPGTLTITFTLVPYADLSVTKTDELYLINVGTNNIYTVVVSNAWNDDAIGATVTDPAPAGTLITGWNAVLSGGAIGNTTGTGDINEIVNIPGGGTIIYTVTVSVPCNFTGTLVNTASVAVPAGITDPNPDNNSATDTDYQNMWTGAVSDDWYTDGNWTIGVPDCAQSFGALIPAGLSVYPVISNTGMNTASLVIASGATLTVNPGKDLRVCGCTALNGTDALYLKSDGTNGNASFITTQKGTISYPDNGSAKVELYLDACLYNLDCSYQISPPVSNALSGVFSGDSLRTYNEVTGLFDPFITGSLEPLYPMQGYLLSNSGDEIRTFHGRLNDSTVTKSLSYTQAAGDGWNLVGNPYPSEIDLSTTLDWSNLDKVVYYYDHVAGNYKPYPFEVGFGLGSQYIPSMQGFFVHVISGFSSGSLKFTDDNRTTFGNVNFYKDLPEDLLWLKVEGSTDMNDEVIIYFRSDVLSGYDQDIDCFKLNGAVTAPQLSAVSTDDYKLAIDALPFTGDHTIVPLEFSISSNITGDFSITASRLESFPSGTRITLEDKKTDSSQLLTNHPVYNFTYTSGDDPERFLLHFYGPFYGIDDKGNNDLQIYSSGHTVYVKDLSGNPEKGEFYLYDMMGKKITQKPVEEISLNKYSFNLPNGYYIVRVITNDKAYNRKVYLD